MIVSTTIEIARNREGKRHGTQTIPLSDAALEIIDPGLTLVTVTQPHDFLSILKLCHRRHRQCVQHCS
jgi:hypothetical protein